MSFDPTMNLKYLPDWLTTNSFVQATGANNLYKGQWIGTMTTALAVALLGRQASRAA